MVKISGPLTIPMQNIARQKLENSFSNPSYSLMQYDPSDIEKS